MRRDEDRPANKVGKTHAKHCLRKPKPNRPGLPWIPHSPERSSGWVKKPASLLPYMANTKGVYGHETMVLADFGCGFVILIEGQ